MCNELNVYKSVPEQLTFSTVRLQAINMKDEAAELGTGTAFFFRFSLPDGFRFQVLVTNRHVVEGYSRFKVAFTPALPDRTPDITNPFVLTHVRDGEDFDWIFHPDKEVDLAILPIDPLLEAQLEGGQPIYYTTLLIDNLPQSAQLSQLDAVEDILMVGYPNGIYDTKHNRPVVRRGITATHPAIRYEGRPEFLIDAACFPGSSGSPVVIWNPSGWTDKDGNTSFSRRFIFLGVLRGGHRHTTQLAEIGDLIPSPSKMAIPNNLGLVLRSELLLDFIPLLPKR
jgi:S1-C subfamily serine protease